MNLLHVYSGNLFGGVETALLALAYGAKLTPGLGCEFAVLFEGRLAEELAAAHNVVHRLPAVRMSRPLSVFAARKALRQLLIHRAYDAVVCHSPWAQAIFGSVVNARGIPLVFWLHDAMTGKHWLERLAARTIPKAAIANSRFTQATIPVLYKDVPVEVIYCPVMAPPMVDSSAHRARLRQQFDTPQDSVVILQSSRLEQWKGHLLLVEALACLGNLPSWTWWIAGGPQRPDEKIYFEKLQARIAELGLTDRVRFLGQRSDVRTLLTAVDIHCQPNLGAEPFGIAFVEALYAGVPVVTTNMGGAVEIVDATCGIVTPPQDARALADALKDLIVSPSLRAELGNNGRARAFLLCDPAAQATHLLEYLRRFIPGMAAEPRLAQSATV